MFQMIANCCFFGGFFRVDSPAPFVTEDFLFLFSFFHFSFEEIPSSKRILYLMVPFAVVVQYLLNRNVVSTNLPEPRKVSEVKRSLSEIFKESYQLKTETAFYGTCQVYQRVLLAIVATSYINTLEQITLMTLIVILINLSYLYNLIYMFAYF